MEEHDQDDVSLPDLPDELWIHMMSYPGVAKALYGVSKKFYDLAHDEKLSHVLYHRISSEESLDNLESFLPSVTFSLQSTKELLEKLKTVACHSEIRELIFIKPRYYYPSTWDDYITALAYGQLTHLRKLCLEGWEIKDIGLLGIAYGNMPNLTNLDLTGSRVGSNGLNTLLREKGDFLTDLNLKSSNIRNLDFLGGDLSLSLKSLNLSHNHVNSALLSFLFSRTTLKSLTSLNLSYNEINDQGLISLAKNNLDNLRILNLSGNQIGNTGFQALLSKDFMALRTLHLHSTNIDDEGFKGISQGALTHLTTLNINKTKIGDLTLHQLKDLKQLKNLYVGSTAITIQGVRDLIHEFNHLRSMDLSGGGVLRDEEAIALANGGFNSLTWLNLSGQKIGGEGIIALARGYFPRLKKLFLSGNAFTSEGVIVMAYHGLPSLSHLKLGDVPINYCTVQAMIHGNLLGLTSFDIETSVLKKSRARNPETYEFIEQLKKHFGDRLHLS